MIMIQIIDDDHWCTEAIIAFLMDVTPDARYSSKTQPEYEDGYDVYIVDNEFESGDFGMDLVRQIRESNPDATIMLCTATHGRIDPAEAMNAGCNALIRKGDAAGRALMAQSVSDHIETRSTASSGGSVAAVMRDVKSILAAWNKRFKQESIRMGSM